VKKNIFFRAFVGFFAKNIMQEMYQGLLNREADVEGLKAYTDALQKNKILSKFLSEMSTSQEAWEKNLYAHSEQIVDIYYRGVLGREPDEASLGYSERIKQGESLENILTAIVSSDEAWHRQTSEHAAQLVALAYRGVLGREPDESGLNEYTKHLRKNGDYEAILRSLSGSRELKDHIKEVDNYENFSQINGLRDYSLIFLDHLSFLPWVMAITDYLSRNCGCKTVLVTRDRSKEISHWAFFSPAVSLVLSNDEFERSMKLLTNRPKMLVVHAFLGSKDKARKIDTFLDADLILYGDGSTNFTNTSYQGYRTKGLLCFGYEQLHETHGHRIRQDLPLLGIVPWRSVFGYYCEIAKHHSQVLPKTPSPRATSMLFLRYWQAGRYQISEEVIIHALTQFLSEHIAQNEILVIKGDYRCSTTILEQLCAAATAYGVTVLSYESYLKCWGSSADGSLPFEMTVTAPMLQAVKNYLVLDSSFALTLPYFLKKLGLSGSTRIVSGITSNAFSKSDSDREIPKIREFVKHYRATLADLVQSLQFQDHDDSCWSVDFDPQSIDVSHLDQEIYKENLLPFNGFSGAVIYVPERQWLTYTLALAQQLASEEVNILFVTPRGVRFDFAHPDYLYAQMEMDHFDRAVRYGDRVSIRRLYVHSYGWKNDIQQLTNLCKTAQLCFYGDGFKNEFAKPRHEQSVFEWVDFGYSLFDWATPKRIVSYSEWLKQIPLVYPIIQPSIPPIEADVLVCLRYYGSGPYLFNEEQLKRLFWQTIKVVLKPGCTVIIKSDKRGPKLTEIVKTLITSQHDGPVIDLADQLDALADESVEVILQTPMLEKIMSFIVFDSSLSYILAHHPAIKPDTQILLGAALDSLEQSEVESCQFDHDTQLAQEEGRAERTYEAALNTINFYSTRYADALVKEDFPVEQLEKGLYLIRKSQKKL